MTKQGKWNLGGMLLLPVAAIAAAAIATLNGVWQAYSDTYIFVFFTNIAITLPAALFSLLFLRRSTGDKARLVAVMPTLLPAVVGAIWYLWYAFFPADVAAGAEYLAAPQYLILIMFATTFMVLLLRITGLAPRTS